MAKKIKLCKYTNGTVYLEFFPRAIIFEVDDSLEESAKTNILKEYLILALTICVSVYACTTRTPIHLVHVNKNFYSWATYKIVFGSVRGSFIYGLKHNTNGPYSFIRRDGKITEEYYAVNDLYHREDGPAIISEYETSWYIEGKLLDFEDFLEKTTIPDDEKLLLALKWSGKQRK